MRKIEVPGRQHGGRHFVHGGFFSSAAALCTGSSVPAVRRALSFRISLLGLVMLLSLLASCVVGDLCVSLAEVVAFFCLF